MNILDKKSAYKATSVLLYAIGFPVLFIICTVASVKWFQFGMYGVLSFVPLFVVLILWALTASIHCIIARVSKKKGKTDAKSLMMKMMIVPIATIIGLFGIFDIVLPRVLHGATSGTILYEDVVFDAVGQHEELLARVNEFKKKNKLDDSVKYTDDEFQNKFNPLFDSMDKAYKAFDKLAVEIALDQPDLLKAIQNGNLPIQLAATLFLATADGNDNNHNLPFWQIVKQNWGTILGAAMNLLGGFSNENINAALNSILVSKTFEAGEMIPEDDDVAVMTYISWNIFNILGINMIFPELDPNAHIFATDLGGNRIKDMGATLAYLDMAWLDGIPMMFFIPLMSLRNVFYAFAAIIALALVLQFYVSGAYKKKFDEHMTIFKNKVETAKA